MAEKIMAAGLDVLEKEPLEPSKPLSQFKDIIDKDAEKKFIACVLILSTQLQEDGIT